MQVKRIGALSAGKVTGAIYALIGLIFGVIFALVSLLGIAIGSLVSNSADSSTAALLSGGGVAVASIIILPVFYGVLGFITGLISAFLYNVVAGFIGGIEVDVE